MRKYRIGFSTLNINLETLFRSIGFDVLSPREMKDTRPDAILFPGGGDITPSFYGRVKDPKTKYTSVTQDLSEVNLINIAKLHEIPTIGICRGHQLLHAAWGGTLIQHVEKHAGVSHMLSTSIPYWGFLSVNSTHHQAVPFSETKKYEKAYAAESDSGAIAEIIIDRPRQLFSFQYHPEYSSCPAKAKSFFTDVMNKELKDVM